MKESAQRSGPERRKAKPRGKPFTGKDDTRRNNGGVPEVTRKLRDLLATEGASEAVEYLRKCVRGEQKDVYITMSGKVKTVPMAGKNRIQAGKHVLEFSLPKPKQELELTGKDGAPLNPVTSYDLSKLTVDELIAWKKLRAKAKTSDDASGS